MTTMPIHNDPLTQKRLQFVGIRVNKLTLKSIYIIQSSNNYNIVSLPFLPHVSSDRHPCLAIDAFLEIGSSEEHKSHQDCVDRLKDRLPYAYEKAEIEARRKGKKYKKYYDQEAKTSLLMPGDKGLVQKMVFKGDTWENSPLIFKKQPMPDIPVYIVQRENSNKKPRLLHWNTGCPKTHETF